MSTKIAYQYDRAGLYAGTAEADESPMEPGVYLLPARCTLVPPPEAPDGKWPRWNGREWVLVGHPVVAPPPDPVEKLREFLAANPDVAAMIQSNPGGV